MDGTLVVGPDRLGRTVHIHDGRVVEQAPPGAPHLPCPDGEIVPGAVDAHTHLYSGLAPLGMPAAEPPPTCFVEILERVWWRLDRALDADTLRAAARLYVAEALLQGTTSLVDHHESPEAIEGSLDVLAEAVEALGGRALLCYGATERNGGPAEAVRGLRECRRLVEAGPRPTVRGLVGLHASFTVGDGTITAAARLCRDLDVPLHVHVAEDGADVQDAVRRGYPGPLERLDELGALVPGSILAHGVHLAPDQVRRAEEAGAWLVHNPRSNEGNAVGFAACLDAGERVALGTDGWPADMQAEAEAAVRLGVAPDQVRQRLAAGHALVAGAFGTEALPLVPGAVGDLLVLPPATALAGEPHRVPRHVVVHGRLVVRDGVLAHGDLERIRAEARAAAPSLWKRMAAR